MYLFINTASADEIILALADGNGQILVKKNIKAKHKQSEKLLLNIDKILKDIKNIKDIKGIIAVKGPGSFTALRIGIATANTIAWALRIPILGVNGDENLMQCVNKLKKVRQFKIVLPEYGLEPNISKPR